MSDISSEIESEYDSESENFLNSQQVSNLTVSVRQRAQSFEDLLSESPRAIMSTAKLEFEPLQRSRSGYRGWVTRNLNGLAALKANGTLNKFHLKNHEEAIKDAINKITELDIQIDAVYQKFSSDTTLPNREADATDIYNFICSTQTKLAEYATFLTPAGGAEGPRPTTLEDVLRVVANKQVSGIKLDCHVFDSDKAGKFEFKTWYDQYKSVLSIWPPCEKKLKLAYLKTKVGGTNAKLLINHLEQTDSNYDRALTLLEARYFDKDFLRDEMFKELLSKKPAFDPDYEKSVNYLTEIQSRLVDLKNTYATDLLAEDSGGHRLVSHIIFGKLSPELQRAIILEVKSNYPTLKQIFDNFEKIIRMIVKTKRTFVPKPDKTISKNANQWTPDNLSLNPTETANFATPSIINKSDPSLPKHCRLCNIDGHTSVYCSKYIKVEDRINQCKTLGLCTRCTSNNHAADACPGKLNKLHRACRFCHKNDHVSTLCPSRPTGRKKTDNNVCLNTSEEDPSPFLLPVFEIGMQGANGNIVKFNVLLDTASSRSYISEEIANELKIDSSKLRPVEYEVCTFLGVGSKEFKETSLTVHLPSGRHLVLPILVDHGFDIKLNVQHLNLAIQNFKQNNIKLAANFDNVKGVLPVKGLVGSDIVQFLKEMRVVGCMNGSALQLASGLLPQGNIDSFLYPEQISRIVNESPPKVKTNNYKTVISKIKVNPIHVNFVLEPKRTYDNILDHVMDDTIVEHRVDKMLSCDSIGIEDSDENISEYDRRKIEEFKKGIKIINNKIYVNLVWNDNIDKVLSNHEICLAILNSVYTKLSRDNLEVDYNKVILNYESEDIIERFECSPEDFYKYGWLAHHPVIKREETASTPLRVVFNCSLKKGQNPSLNEASYVGVNLMGDMLSLLMQFRTNKHVLLADLRKAFLMIKLRSEKDKNRFCFFVKFGNRLICFRFTTIIFGFNSSPFILNYVIKFLAQNYPDDKVSDVWKNIFFCGQPHKDK